MDRRWTGAGGLSMVGGVVEEGSVGAKVVVGGGEVGDGMGNTGVPLHWIAWASDGGERGRSCQRLRRGLDRRCWSFWDGGTRGGRRWSQVGDHGVVKGDGISLDSGSRGWVDLWDKKVAWSGVRRRGPRSQYNVLDVPQCCPHVWRLGVGGRRPV